VARVTKNQPSPVADEWEDWLRDWTYSIRPQHRPQTVTV